MDVLLDARQLNLPLTSVEEGSTSRRLEATLSHLVNTSVVTLPHSHYKKECGSESFFRLPVSCAGAPAGAPGTSSRSDLSMA